MISAPFIGAIAAVLSASALSFYELRDRKFGKGELSRIEAFLTEAASLLPERVKTEIGGTIPVTFAKLSDSATPYLPLPSCGRTLTTQLGKDHIYGVFDSETKEIVLNELFFYDIVFPGAKNRTYPCGHKRMYQLALASLLHETAHRYDELNLSDPVQEQEYAQCPHWWQKYCRRLKDDLHRETTVSTRQTFKKLVNWSDDRWGQHTKNTVTAASPDPYEVTSLREEFAVNMEYFLLDPDYARKRPTYYHYFATHFAHRPFSGSENKPNLAVPSLKVDGKEFPVDPDRVYRVDYALAEAGGSDLASQWGHVMLRLVHCAPDRSQVDVTCLKDTKYHVVINYTAQVDTPSAEVIKGLTGGYPSAVKIVPYEQIREEYIFKDNRSIKSYRLDLTDTQKTLLIYRAFEDYWTYQGRYEFLTNNCVTECRDILQSVLGQGPFIYRRLKTPSDMHAALLASNLIPATPDHIDTRKSIKLATLLGKVVPKYDETAREQLALQLLAEPSEMHIPRHQEWFAEIDARSTSPLVRAQGYKDVLEVEKFLRSDRQRVLNRRRSAVIENILQEYNIRQDVEVPPHIQEVRDLIGKLNALSVRPATSYGIPLDHSGNHVSMRKTLMETLSSKLQELERGVDVFDALGPERVDAMDADANVESIRQQMLSLLH